MKYFTENISVKAKTPEKAAKKIYRMNKRKYYELGHIIIKDETGDEWSFICSRWLRKGSYKFKN
jgi:hypothetical protein